MSDLTPVVPETTPPSAETVQPATPAPTETVEELKARVAAAEEEAKRWKNRVAEENPKKKKDPLSEEDLDWKLKFHGRVQRVEEAFQKELQDLEASGAKLTNALKTKALEYAESKIGIANVEPSGVVLPSPSVDRTATREPQLTDTDRALNVKPETVKEFRDYVER